MSKQDSLEGIFANLEDILAHPRVLGLAPIFQDLRAFVSQEIDKYPPHNVIKHGEKQWLIEVAVAGFGRDELEVTVTPDTLIIVGKSTFVESADAEFVHRGVARRPFRLTFKLGDHCEVGEASYQSGMLLVPIDLMTTKDRPVRKILITEYDSAPSHTEAAEAELVKDQFEAAVEEQLADIVEDQP